MRLLLLRKTIMLKTRPPGSVFSRTVAEPVSNCGGASQQVADCTDIRADSRTERQTDRRTSRRIIRWTDRCVEVLTGIQQHHSQWTRCSTTVQAHLC